MFINITDSAAANNKGSSGKLVNYLEKENRLFNKDEPENWFNHMAVNIEPYEVRQAIDNNIAKLCKTDAKFFLVNISPSQKELKYLNNEFGEDGLKDQIKIFAEKVMDAYAKNFRRDGISSAKDLLWFAKVENNRYYTYKDKEVIRGEKKRGEVKSGDQMHIQIIVSRKDATNRIKLSPQNTSRGKNTEHSKKMGQFDRVAFKQSGESLFDELFGFDRSLKETMIYANTQKNGTLSERIQMQELEEKTDCNDIGQTKGHHNNEILPELWLPAVETYSREGSPAGSVNIGIQDDIDDEAINGRNRQRKRQARTNTR
ncbi:DUF5712 family protein [Pedobacter miscanthi]|uniref:Molybdopterin-guanine dinucleotide biosynthesis protein MobB n=1 Tax=Pedobacter miscanthi TaxID=2259170 RepID=A0A366KM06_9SPHI|nr:DUF5712 family protein [Pedobacter miscanthi]RBQ02695.1 molybdopterin-guanine dinucleotide biosynthesis protein MobB [Pedobacter miscanthi]